MARTLRMACATAMMALLCPMSLWAQFDSELVGFNGPPIDDPDTSREMFQQPGFSGSTSGYIVADPNNPYDAAAAFRASGLQTEGAAAMQVYFHWIDPADPDSWLRLTTFNGPERPNPSLHTAGKVRFKITNQSEFFRGEVGLCLGIRETGVAVPQMYDGGTSGDIEWVGVDPTPNGIVVGPDGIVDTAATGDDVQVYDVGTDILGLGLPTGTAVITPGPNGTIDTTPVDDDELRSGYRLTASGSRMPIPAITLPVNPSAYSVEWNLATGVVRVNGTPHDFAVAGFTGNGLLDVSPSRGTLEHIAFVNVVSDASERIEVAIDELQFESPEEDPVPEPTVVTPILEDDTEVVVTDIYFASERVTLYVNSELLEARDISEPDDVTFTIDPAVPGDVYTATLTVDGVEGPHSEPAVVQARILGPWTQTSDLPMGLTDHQLVVLNGYIYCIGGRSNDSPQATDGVFYAAINDDGTLGTWQATTSLPGTTATPGAAAYDGRVYVWGGWAVGFPTINTCWYASQNPDGTLGAWTTSGVTIPDNVDVSPPGIQMDAMGRGVMIFDDKLYIINGEWDNGASFGNTNNCYYSEIAGDGDYGPWVMTTPTATANGSWFHGVAAIEGTTQNYMYRVAGNYRGTTERDMYRSVIQSDGSLGDWVQDPQSLPEGRYEHACTVANNKWLFAICGLSGGDPQNSVYYTSIDPDTGALDAWIRGLDYPETVSRNCATSYEAGGKSYVLVAGGGPYSGTAGNRTPSCYYAEVGEPTTLIGDVDGDGDVDLSDLAALLGAYRACVGDPDYLPEADFDDSGCVDLSDLAALLGNYGTGT